MNKSQFFLLMEPMQESMKTYKLNISITQILVGLYEFTSHTLMLELDKKLGIDLIPIEFGNVFDESTYIIQGLKEGNVFKVDLVSNYLDEKYKDIASNIRFTNITTVPVIDFDPSSKKFILGMENIRTRKLITISLEDYHSARTQKIFLYQISNKIFKNLRNDENREICDNEIYVRRILSNCSSKTYSSELKKLINSFIIINEYNKEYTALQYNTMTLGSTSGYYYEFSKALKDLSIGSNETINNLEDVGKNFKSMIREVQFLSQELPGNKSDLIKLNNLIDDFYDEKEYAIENDIG